MLECEVWIMNGDGPRILGMTCNAGICLGKISPSLHVHAGMALIARMPLAVAPAMGVNAYFSCE